MNLARIMYPVRTLGPGERIGLWLCGCSHGCKGCSNPELWQPRKEYDISVENLLKLVRSISDSSNHFSCRIVPTGRHLQI